jgi:tripeptide aminopeptidase
VTAAPSSRLDTIERRYLSGTFAELCRIESPSGSERRCAERVAAELRELGIEPSEDGAGAVVGSDSGNLLARIPATRPDAARQGAGSLLLGAHLDTVPAQAPIEPVLVDGVWENENAGILGADNKAAVAMLLALARHVQAHGSPLDIELLFTVREENGVAGARAFDVSRLRSEYGYVFDHASPIGGVIVASPTHFAIEGVFRGAAAHAGIRPEQGRSAIVAAARAIAEMRLGRLDGETTANIGTIAGGSAINVVAEECRVTAEARSLDEKRAEQVVAEMVDRMQAAANVPEWACDLDISVERLFTGYRLPPSAPAVTAAEAALRSCGYEPERLASGGGSDANALLADGFQTVNLANGTERNHEPGERVSAQALEDMLLVTLALLEEAARTPAVAH